MWFTHCIVLPDVRYVSNALWLCALVWPLHLLEGTFLLGRPSFASVGQRALSPEAILNDIFDLEAFCLLAFWPRKWNNFMSLYPVLSECGLRLGVPSGKVEKGIYGYWLTPWGGFYTTSPLGKRLPRDSGFWVGVCDLNPALLRALTIGIYLPGKHWLQRSLTPEDVLAYRFWHLRNSLTLWPTHPGIKFILYFNWHFYLCNTWRDFHIARKISIMLHTKKKC